MTCANGKQDATCATSFITSFGKQVYRRPFAADDTARYTALYQKAIASGYDFKTGIEWIVFAMLQSPQFLYRFELGATPMGSLRHSRRRTRSRRASRTSTCRACRTPRSSRPPTRASWPRRRRSKRRRGGCWPIPRAGASSTTSSSGSTPTRCPTWCATRRSTRTSTRRCRRCCRARRARSSPISLSSPTGTLDALFTAPYTFANAALAKHYGLTGPTGSTFQRVDAPGRAGVLTQGMMLAHDKATSTSIVRRGLKIRTDVLCQIVPAPPPNVDLSALDKDATGVSQRQRLEQHRDDRDLRRLPQPHGSAGRRLRGLRRRRSFPRTIDETRPPRRAHQRRIGHAATPTVRSRPDGARPEAGAERSGPRLLRHQQLPFLLRT